VNERKLQQVIILAAAVLAVSAAAFLWFLGGEGTSMRNLLAFNGLFLLGACILCWCLGRGDGEAPPPPAQEDEAVSLVQTRLQKYLRDEPGENG